MTAHDKNALSPTTSTAPATLGEILYRDRTDDEALDERTWVRLVNYVAAGDQRALRQLYERAHRLVFSLIARITNSRDVAENLTVEVFSDVWRQAYAYDPAAYSVLGWMLSLARAQAEAWLRFDRELDTEVLTPRTPLWAVIAYRIVSEFGVPPAFTATEEWTDPDWNEVAAGIWCKILSTDEQRDRVSMLLRLQPHVEYPAHMHAGVEELHLLQGELTIDGRKLQTGDYHRAEPGTSHVHVHSETGCACVVITSPRDVLR